MRKYVLSKNLSESRHYPRKVNYPQSGQEIISQELLETTTFCITHQPRLLSPKTLIAAKDNSCD